MEAEINHMAGLAVFSELSPAVKVEQEGGGLWGFTVNPLPRVSWEMCSGGTGGRAETVLLLVGSLQDEEDVCSCFLPVHSTAS